jgi:hypothetical protein
LNCNSGIYGVSVSLEIGAVMGGVVVVSPMGRSTECPVKMNEKRNRKGEGIRVSKYSRPSQILYRSESTLV